MQYKIRKFSSLPLHPDCRWDGEYLCFEPYKNESLQYVPVGDTLTSSQYGVSIEMNEDGIGTKIYRMNEIGGTLCDRTVSKYAELDADEISAYKLHDRDVLFNRTNSQAFVGRTGLFRAFSEEDIVFASYLVRVNPKPEIITPEYMTAFLNTKYGMLDVKRRARISINQSNVNAEELKRVEIPLVSGELQQKVTQAFDAAFNLTQASATEYDQAQNILLAELGLTNWQPEHRLSFVKNFSDTQQAGRVDADYFQPKYDKVVAAIKNYPRRWDTLGSLTRLNDKGFNPEDKTEYKYIELANIAGNGEITGCMIEQGLDLPSRARRKVAAGDVIVSSIEGSLSSIALIYEEFDQALCSTGFYVINSQAFNSETLLILLKSIAVQPQLKKGCNGTILAAINKVEFSNLVLPMISEETQAQIQQRVTESFNLRKQSKHLLDCSKRAVEIAIEQDEQTAINWLGSEPTTL